jgi:hypothetical protein
MRRRSEELTEIGRLFRAKLRQLREQERPRAQRSTAPRRRRVRLDAVESPPSDAEVLSSSDLAGLFKCIQRRWRGGQLKRGCRRSARSEGIGATGGET